MFSTRLKVKVSAKVQMYLVTPADPWEVNNPFDLEMGGARNLGTRV